MTGSDDTAFDRAIAAGWLPDAGPSVQLLGVYRSVLDGRLFVEDVKVMRAMMVTAAEINSRPSSVKVYQHRKGKGKK